MSKRTKSICTFQNVTLNYNAQQMIKGGGSTENAIAKKLSKLAKAMKAGDTKGMAKHQDELDCLGYNADCCGNGIGIW